MYIKFIKIHSAYKVFNNRLVENFKKLLSRAVLQQRINYLFSSCDSIIMSIAQVIIYVLGGIEIINGKLSIGAFTIIINYLSKILDSSRFFLNLGKSYQDNLVSYKRIEEILKIVDEEQGNYILDEISSIEVKDLSFKYSSEYIVKNINLTFNKGNIYFIKGGNGAGKSTLIDLVIGMYIKSYDGEIFYNGINIKSIDMKQARQNNIAVTEQEPILMNDTLENNIYLNHAQKVDDIEYYLSVLGIDEYIHSLKKEEIIFNDSSSNISGGEKQKVSLLRAILKNSEVLILDEPTSAMDYQSKIKFLEYIKHIKLDKIIIIISHDEMIYDIADEVIELAKGIIV